MRRVLGVFEANGLNTEEGPVVKAKWELSKRVTSAELELDAACWTVATGARALSKMLESTLATK